jgi:hypothetical protein
MSDYISFRLGDRELDHWDDYIDNSKNGTIFHKIEWLKAIGDHSESDLIPVAVRKGDNIVCLFPLVFQKKVWFENITVTSRPLRYFTSGSGIEYPRIEHI